MRNRLLQNVKKIVLQAGHGGRDPGAVANNTTESIENNQIIVRISRLLSLNGVDHDVTPDLPFLESINYINRTYRASEIWAIEIHKDSSGGNPDSLRNRLGVYYFGGDSDSAAIANQIRNVAVANGASNSSWFRPDTVSRFGRLGWLRDVTAVSHLIECGFLQDDNSDAADEKYARWVARGLTEALDKSFRTEDAPAPQPIPVPQPQPTPQPTPINNDPWSGITDFDTLTEANTYKNWFRNNDWRSVMRALYDKDKKITELEDRFRRSWELSDQI
jgi:N-acetylmuramoyl-L-alanine amidase